MDSKIERFLTKIGVEKLNDFENAYFSKLINDKENNRIIATIKNINYFSYDAYKDIFSCCEKFISNGGFAISLSFEYEKETNISKLIEEYVERTFIYDYQIFDKEKKIIVYYTNENLYSTQQRDNYVSEDTLKLGDFLNNISSTYKVYLQEKVTEKNTMVEDLEIQEKNKIESLYKENKQNRIDQSSYHLVKIKDMKNFNNVIVEGKIFATETKTTKKNLLMKTVKFNDGSDSTYITLFEGKTRTKEELDKYEKGVKIKVKGSVEKDVYNKNELCIKPNTIVILPPDPKRVDNAIIKRVELHLHTKMSTLDGVTSISEYIKQIKALGHKALAITDHGVVQAFPNALTATKKDDDFKVIYGCEFYVVNSKRNFIYNPSKQTLKNATYVVFDTETTGLSCKYNRLIEFGAVKIKASGEKIDEVDFFIRPEQKLSKFAIEHCHISQMEADQGKPIKQALKEIKEFFGDAILVAHNATFDYDFINEALLNNGMEKINNPVIDTLEISRVLYPDLRSHREEALARFLQIEFDDTSAHRANYDAEHLALILNGILSELYKINPNIKHEDLANLQLNEKGLSSLFANHITAYAKNFEGIKNLYRLVSIASTEHISRDGNPLITKEELSKYRDNLILGSACLNGEVFETAMTKGEDTLKEAMQYFDFIEVQPPRNYLPLIYKGSLNDEEAVKNVLSDIIRVAKSINKLVCATGDVHYFSKDEKQFRDVMIAAEGLKKVRHPLNFAPYKSEKNQKVLNNWYTRPLENPDQEFLTTDEMKEQFSFLKDSSLIDEIVVKNTNYIAEQIEKVIPITQGIHPPVMPGCEENLVTLVWKSAKEKYGDPLPSVIKERIDTELRGILDNGYSVIYWLSSMIVNWTNKQGYIVGSRGSVGSSLVALFSGITEVNALPPHYICPKCKNLEWADINKYESGFDLEPKKCPKCGCEYDREGQNIPFATFLGFHAEKVPDIDLNFASDYQDESMIHLGEELNKTGNSCYRAGTIQAIQEKQAIGYVLGYYESLGINTSTISMAQKEYLASGCIDIRRSTGQHPGGIVVIPKGMEVYDFTPYQYPANNTSATWKTTHFDFHAIHDNVLKFDALSHIDPCAVKFMNDLCGFKFTSLSKLKYDVDITDPKVVDVFISPKTLNLKQNVLKQETGALGLPEFGTVIGRKTLLETKPKTFSDLVRICGLSHGTDVFSGNARELILNDGLTLSDVICCRDDIMITLSQKYDIDNSIAFKIMEIVRKGNFNYKKLGDEFYKLEQIMKDHKVPEYYINSCKKIQYLFPKAHAVAYVSMACRCAWFKIYKPKEYYAAFFSLRLSAYDYETMIKGIDACLHKINIIRNKIENHEKVDAKEENLIDTYEATIEMYDRGIEFDPISIEKSDSTKFIINKENGKLIPPFITLDSLGETIAKEIVEERNKHPFTSIEDLRKRAHVNDTLIGVLKKIHALDNLSEDERISLF